MAFAHPPTSPTLVEADILARLLALRTHAVRDTRGLLDHEHASVSAFVARSRERIASLVIPTACLAVVLEGTKELHHAGQMETFHPGEAAVLRPGWRGDVVNRPDPSTGLYRTLLLSFPAELMLRVLACEPDLRSRAPRPGMQARITVDAALCAALAHAADGLARTAPSLGLDGSALSRSVIEHRICEVLIVLGELGVLPIEPERAVACTADGMRLLVRGRIDRSWTSAAVSSGLGVSEATLRRRLAREGTSFGRVLREERMEAARRMIGDGASVTKAAEATGYASRSHFGRHFRALFNEVPSRITAQGTAGCSNRAQA